MEAIAPDPAYMLRAMTVFILMMLGGALMLVVEFLALPGGLAGSRSAAYSASLIGFGVLGFGFMALMLKRGRLLVGPNAIGRQDVLGRRQMWTASEIGAVVDATVLIRGRRPPRRYVFFLGLDGRRLIMLNDVAWSGGAIDRLVQASCKTPQVRGPLTPSDLRREFPGTFNWLVAHPYVFVGAVFILVIVISAAVSLGAGRN